MQQHYPIFTVTPQGILVDGVPLAKSASHVLPPQTLREIGRIEELLRQVKKEDWDTPILYTGGKYPPLVKAHMRAALLSPQPFEKYSPDQPRVPAGNPDGGQWTDEGGDSGEATETRVESYEPAAHTTRQRSKVSPNRYVSKQDGITEADLQNPRFKGMDNTRIKKQKFVDTHLTTVKAGAKQLDVPVENLLVLSSVESGWGQGNSAKDGNNFFGLHHPASFEIGSRPAKENPKVRIAQFASYSDSMRSFIEDYGYLVQNVSDPTQFARNLQDSGKFGIDKYGKKVPHYVSDISETVERIHSVIEYTRKSGK